MQLEGKILVLTREQEVGSHACVAVDISTVCDVVEQNAFTKGVPHTVAFIGAGCADAETQLLTEMRRRKMCVTDVAFMDNTFTTSTLRHWQEYTDLLLDNMPRPALVFTFQDLHKWLQQQRTLKPNQRLVVIGINAGMTFETPDDLYQCHAFLCACAAWGRQGVMHPEYLNFLGDSNSYKTANSCMHSPGSWCNHVPWWDLSKEIITCKAASRLLVA